MSKTILVAGATGRLGEKVIAALLDKGATVRVIVRQSSDPEKLKQLEKHGVQVYQADMSDVAAVTRACAGVSCVVSVLSGLEDVIVGTQKVLLDAAIAAGVPRFIPSDYSLDFTSLPAGQNRNFDLRRAFHAYLDQAPIAATTIFNGPFTELLTGDMPLILFNKHRILYWGKADHRMDFTTMDDTAAFTAQAAMDAATPRFLRIVGDQISAREMSVVAGSVTGAPFRLLRAGGMGLLGILIRIARTVAPGKGELYPAWQGMQYMRDMQDTRAYTEPYDNDRYPGMRWTTVQDVLTARQESLN